MAQVKFGNSKCHWVRADVAA